MLRSATPLALVGSALSVVDSAGLAMRGRKPHPTKLRILHGNPQRRPLNEREPQHGPLDPTCPEQLTDINARAEWTRIAESLVAAGHICHVDRAALLGYCLKYGQWMALEAEAARHPFIVRAPSGYPMPNPALTTANKVFSLVLKAAAELGITPSSRSRIVALATSATNDEFGAFQRSRA